MANFIYTRSGVRFDYKTFTAEDIRLGDISHALSQLCRYTGHTIEFWSVAQHSILVSEMVAIEHPEYELEALLHDASEAYINDLAKPLKDMATMDDYNLLERRVQTVLSDKWGLRFPFPTAVNRFDKFALNVEAPVLLPWPEGTLGLEMPNVAIKFWRRRLCELITYDMDTVKKLYEARAGVLLDKRRCIL